MTKNNRSGIRIGKGYDPYTKAYMVGVKTEAGTIDSQWAEYFDSVESSEQYRVKIQKIADKLKVGSILRYIYVTPILQFDSTVTKIENGEITLYSTEDESEYLTYPIMQIITGIVDGYWQIVD